MSHMSPTPREVTALPSRKVYWPKTTRRMNAPRCTHVLYPIYSGDFSRCHIRPLVVSRFIFALVSFPSDHCRTASAFLSKKIRPLQNFHQFDTPRTDSHPDFFRFTFTFSKSFCFPLKKTKTRIRPMQGLVKKKSKRKNALPYLR